MPQVPTLRKTQVERSQATTKQLLDAARALFAANGYAATSLEEVADRAGVTKGAVYHHFQGKLDLFRAVYEVEQRRLGDAQAKAFAREPDIWSGFYAGCAAFFRASLDPGVQRITLLDGPAVLGWETMREVESRYALAQLRAGLELAIAGGHVSPRPVEPLAYMLLGALCEAARMVARSDHPATATSEVLDEVRTLLGALAAPIPPGFKRDTTGSGSDALA